MIIELARIVGFTKRAGHIEAFKVTLTATHIPDRAACADWLTKYAKPGDRIVIMGARDDTLSKFTRGVLDGLAEQN